MQNNEQTLINPDQVREELPTVQEEIHPKYTSQFLETPVAAYIPPHNPARPDQDFHLLLFDSQNYSDEKLASLILPPEEQVTYLPDHLPAINEFHQLLETVAALIKKGDIQKEFLAQSFRRHELTHRDDQVRFRLMNSIGRIHYLENQAQAGLNTGKEKVRARRKFYEQLALDREYIFSILSYSSVEEARSIIEGLQLSENPPSAEKEALVVMMVILLQLTPELISISHDDEQTSLSYMIEELLPRPESLDFDSFSAFSYQSARLAILTKTPNAFELLINGRLTPQAAANQMAASIQQLTQDPIKFLEELNGPQVRLLFDQATLAAVEQVKRNPPQNPNLLPT